MSLQRWDSTQKYFNTILRGVGGEEPAKPSKQTNKHPMKMLLGELQKPTAPQTHCNSKDSCIYCGWLSQGQIHLPHFEMSKVNWKNPTKRQMPKPKVVVLRSHSKNWHFHRAIYMVSFRMEWISC